MFRIRSVLIVLVLVGLFPNRARAQGATQPRADSTLNNILARIAAAGPHSLRIASRATGRVQGSGVYLRGDTVIVMSDQSERAFAFVDVDSVWEQRGTAALLLGVIAAVPCALYLGAVSAFFATDPDSNGRPGAGTAAALVGGAIGVVVCGTVGAGVGSLIKRWRLEYARPLEAPNRSQP